MAGGSFSFSPRYTPTGQAKFVLNVGLVPEATGSSCSLKCLCKGKAGYGMSMDELALTEGSTSGGGGSRCEASSWGRYSELDGCQVLGYSCDPSSSPGAGDHLVLMMDAFNATCNSNCASPCISWSGQNSHSLSAYMDAANHNLLADETEGQRASYGSANPSQGRSHKFKPDDASSHNNNNNIMLCKRSGDLEAGFPSGNERDLEVEELAGLSESINDSLLQDGEQKTKGKEEMKAVGKGSKRKAAESVKNPRGAEVQSEERNKNDSRIVRVSRMTGGKDRHSKVRTARGLRDRRVRLSVPTAIQFYDLQDRLGCEQPSMAVDWLMNAAKAAIDDLQPLADASNVTHSNSSPVKSAVGSPKESATASVGVENEKKIAVHEQLPIRTAKDSHVGRSGSSTTDGTEYSSKLARLKVARERARKKARNPAASSQAPHTNMLQSSAAGDLMNGMLSGTSTIQQLWDYSMQDISCKEHSHQFQHMPASSTSTASLQQADMQPFLRSYSHQSFDMADFTTTFMDPKQRPVVGNAAQVYWSSLMDHQSQAMQKHLGSTPVPSDVNFTTSDHSSRGPLQSNSSCITSTNTPLLHKNAFADASAKMSMLPFLAYDSRIPERLQTYFLDGNAKYEMNH